MSLADVGGMPTRTTPNSLEVAQGYWFDHAAAEAAVVFFERYTFFTTGEWAGKPFVLEPWQEQDIVRPLFGWKRADGTRRYRRCFVWVPRKNGKTELAAGIALLLLMGDGEPGAQVLSIATDKNQASIVFDKAVAMLGYSKDLQPHLTAFRNSIYCPAIAGVFKPLSGIPKGKHGLNMSGLVGDEIHEWDSDRLYQFVHQSSGARRQPLEFLISTAGEMQGYGFEAWKECEAILSGTIVDHETLIVVYAADADRDKADPDYWKSEEARKRANPNYGKSIKSEYLEAELRKALRLPRLENDFKRFHLNLWVEQATRWLPMDAWADCGTAPAERAAIRARVMAEAEGQSIAPKPAGPAIIVTRDIQRWQALPGLMKGRQAFGGIDLSSTKDLTCLCWIFPPLKEGGLLTVVPRFYCPRATLQDRVKSDKVPYDLWAKQGALITTPGNAVDYAWLKRDAIKDAEQYRVGSIAIDRYNATHLTMELRDEGLEAQLFGQGFVSMSSPSKELEKLLLARMLDHGGHPVLSWCARNVAVSTDAAGNIKPDKPKSAERIDGIVALVNALGAMMTTEKEEDISAALANPVIR